MAFVSRVPFHPLLLAAYAVLFVYAANIGSWVVPGILCALVYLSLSLPLSRFARRLERRWSLT